MPTLDITLCGPPLLRREDGSLCELALPTKALALLAFLAVEPGMHSRERLAVLLWGESPEHKASASLRQALSSLRRMLRDRIQITRTTVGLDRGLTSDVGAFLELARTDPIAASRIEVYRFLEGLAPRHCPTFDDWLDATRGDLRIKYCRTLAVAGQDAIARRDWRHAGSVGEQWSRIDPESCDAAHLLVEALFLAGDTPAAMNVHDIFVARLRPVQDAPGMTALRALVARIRSEQTPPHLGRSSDTWHESTPTFEAALVGRATEWEALRKAWADTAQGVGRVVVIEGVDGAGKTRLTTDFARWVTTQGGQVLSTRAHESGLTTQLGVMLELLRGALHCPGVGGADPITLGIVARILPEVRRRFPAVVIHDSEPGSAVLEEAIAHLLLAIAEDQPLLVVVDDFHWCDPETGAMLHYLVRRLEQAPVVWAVALTLGHQELDAQATRVIRAMRAVSPELRLQLRPLTRDEVWDVLRDLGRIRSESTGRRLAERIHSITHGNPFYVIELLKTWLADGWFAADPDTGEWTLSRHEDFEVDVGTVSPSVQDAIARRIARLPNDQQWLLTTIAAHDHGCRAEVLSHVHGMSRLRVSILGDEMEERFLVRESDGRYECAHPIIATVVLAARGPGRRRELHRAIALAMMAAARERGTPPDPSEVALHADLGEVGDLACEQALLASQSARNIGATGEARHWLDVAARWASSREETAAVDRATADLLGGAGALEAPVPTRPRRHTTLSRHDFDLMARPA